MDKIEYLYGVIFFFYCYGDVLVNVMFFELIILGFMIFF